MLYTEIITVRGKGKKKKALPELTRKVTQVKISIFRIIRLQYVDKIRRKGHKIIFENYKPHALWNRGRRAGKLYGSIPLEKSVQLIQIHDYQMLTQIMKSHHIILWKTS